MSALKDNSGSTTERSEKQQAAQYIATMLRELQKIAASNDMRMLGNMLSLSSDEARKHC